MGSPTGSASTRRSSSRSDASRSAARRRALVPPLRAHLRRRGEEGRQNAPPEDPRDAQRAPPPAPPARAGPRAEGPEEHTDDAGPRPSPSPCSRARVPRHRRPSPENEIMDLCNQRAPLGHPAATRCFASSGFGLPALGCARGPPGAAALDGAGPRCARAKRCRSSSAGGAPSRGRLDHKPRLAGRNGATLSGVRRGAKLLAPFKFMPSGRSGLMSPSSSPAREAADKLCLLRGMHTEVRARGGDDAMHTGSFSSSPRWVRGHAASARTRTCRASSRSPPPAAAAPELRQRLPAATYQGLRIGLAAAADRLGAAQTPVEDIANPRQSSKLRRQLDLEEAQRRVRPP